MEFGLIAVGQMARHHASPTNDIKRGKKHKKRLVGITRMITIKENVKCGLGYSTTLSPTEAKRPMSFIRRLLRLFLLLRSLVFLRSCDFSLVFFPQLAAPSSSRKEQNLTGKAFKREKPAERS